MRQKSFGMLSMDDGSYLLATCENRNGKWHLLSTSRWSGDNWLKNALLLHRGVIAAAPCRWLPAEHLPSDGIAPPPMAARLSPIADQGITATFESRLYGNLLGVVPEDSFLCAIPLGLDPEAVRSFISVFQTEQFYKIGIVNDGALAAVFSMAPGESAALENHLARIGTVSDPSIPKRCLAFPPVPFERS